MSLIHQTSKLASALDSEHVRSESVTLRINKRFLDSLRTESGEKEISLNTLMNQMIKHHIYWHSVAPKVGFIPVRKDLIITLFSKYSEQEMLDIGEKMGREKTKEMLLLVGNNYNLIAALEMIEAWIRASGFSYKRSTNGNKYSCALEHGMGQKWSVYLLEVFRAILAEFSLNPTFQFTGSILKFEIEFE